MKFYTLFPLTMYGSLLSSQSIMLDTWQFNFNTPDVHAQKSIMWSREKFIKNRDFVLCIALYGQGLNACLEQHHYK